MRFSLGPLRVRLLLLALLAVLPAFGLIAYAALEQRRSAVADAVHESLRFAQRAASEQNHVLVGARAWRSSLSCEGTTRPPAVRSSPTSSGDFRPIRTSPS